MVNAGKRITGTAQVTTSPCTLWSINYALSTGGRFVLRDGDGSGVTLADIDLAATTNIIYFPYGLRFRTKLHCTFSTAVGSATLFVS